MNSFVKCLDQQTIAALLDGSLSAQETAEIESHLNECQSCCRAVESAFGSDRWWRNAGRYLRDEIAPLASESPSANRDVDSWAREATAARASSTQESDRIHFELTRLLAPTDYPDMLGRIGHYEIAGILGYGGMGGVFKGFDRSLHRFVAIKMLLPHLAVSAASRARFAREAKAIAAVVDDHVMAIHGVDQWNSVPYFVMPLLRGESLQTRLNDHGALGLREVLRISMQAAKGLAAAHAQGIVHRDVKPANIFLDGETDRAQLMDFGVAVALDDPSLTKTGILTGTPQFMSPEQARSETVTARSDLFSLGSVIYSMATGEAPFRAETIYGLLRLITDQSPRPIREINPDAPPWLDKIVSKLMEKTPTERFESAEEVAELLQGCLAHIQQPTSVALPCQLDAIGPLDSRLIDRTQVAIPRLVFTSIVLAVSILVASYFSVTDRTTSRVTQIEMLPHEIVVDGRDRLSVAQLWDRWKEMPVGSKHERRAKRRLHEVYESETNVSSAREYLSRRRQWATEILPLVTSGVTDTKADFLLGFLQPLDPAMQSRLDFPNAGNDGSYPLTDGESDRWYQGDFETVGWDIQTTLAMTLGRSGRHTDAELVIDNLVQQIQANIDSHGGDREVPYLGYYQPIRSVMNWCCFYRATIQNMTVVTLEKHLEDKPPNE
ncbi:protein kinase domain-containing protein [Rhodopirellula sallentina]|uniref:non-specific serine/threonine protein kinase n=1 Tax=Rhodopirellula sallentina SM41 TaxID=1263870 RepID=M5UDH9_9BACT|nr:protein kinase [Rhodopirellula sallentina]EMI54058.1 serine/threonine protein kinase [Rhodopirellula sallentina SM41]